ncbi:MAG TPA: pyrrolo-quinoline quinone [Verrucomicrobiales bacterium]|nr:pyrrolo-quinoline quinone [Verrucomicrobiales bacterium]
MRMPQPRAVLALLVTLLLLQAKPGLGAAAAAAAAPEGLFARSNLVAWCIVPFDARKRGPEARAEMLERLGFQQFAYDYRAEHIPTFDAEVEALQRHHVRLLAWWFPTTLNDEGRGILAVLKRHALRGVQLWVMGGGDAVKNPGEQELRVASEASRIRPIAEAAAAQGCSVALYNHGGWFGEPENQIAIIERLRPAGITNVGIVYNLHHGHDHLPRLPALLARMKPHLLAFNLNGMFRDGERLGKKIVPIGQGELDGEVLGILRDSGWQGPVGILNHTDEDAEGRLRDNLEGLDWLVAQVPGHPAAARPQPRTWRDPSLEKPPVAKPGSASSSGAAPSPYWTVEDPAERERLPLYQTIPAATPGELTPSNGRPVREVYRNWHRSHGDNGGTRFSALDHINRKTVNKLQVAWTYHSRDGSNNIQCNPIILRGVMYAPTPGKYIVAVDAATGRELWRFKPEGRPAFRGLIHWPGREGASERILFCSGKHLYALDPSTGRPVAGFGEQGRTMLPGGAQGDFGAATAAPTTFENIVVVPGFEKDVWGFDVVTGRLLWTFHTVPHPGEPGYETWDRTETYGANAWAGMAMDDTRGIAYITTGGPKPNFIGISHLGQNLYANCLVAIDARTGKHLWHFQEIRHDLWDLDMSAPPNLGTITRDGRRIDIVAACTKIGNTLLLDRVTGKPIFPFRLRRAPTSTLPGERTWPYQPDVELPEPFLHMEYTADDLTTRNEEVAEWARSQFASASKGFFVPCAEGRANLFFGIDGGAEWTGACIDPDTGRLYVSANHIGWLIAAFRDEDPPDTPGRPKTRGRQVYEAACMQCHGPTRLGIGTCPPLRGLRFRLTDEAVRKQIREGKNSMPAQTALGEEDLKALIDYLMLRDGSAQPRTTPPERPSYSTTGYPKFYDPEGFPANKPPWGTLNCIDLNTGRQVWRVPLGEYPQLAGKGGPKTGTENYGGAIVTAGGLVFCAGTRDNKIRAFDKETGEELWAAQLPFTGNAPPATYEINGRQFVVIAATGGNKLGTPYGDAYVAFALPPSAPSP